MVQRKLGSRIGIKAPQTGNPIRTDIKTSSLAPDVCSRENDKMIKKAKSFKLSRSESSGTKNDLPQSKKHDLNSSHIIPVVKKVSPVRSADGLSPNYMKTTSSWVARKESLQVNPKQKITCRDRGSKVTIYSKRSNGSSKPPVKLLRKNSSLKSRRLAMKNGLEICSSSKSIGRRTCSSALKDRCSPNYLELNTCGTEADGTSVLQVCPYSYCSLNNHRSDIPLRRFLSMKRRMFRAQKNTRPKHTSAGKAKICKEGKKEIDTGQNVSKLAPVIHETFPPDEEEDTDFVVEIYTVRGPKTETAFNPSLDSENSDVLLQEDGSVCCGSIANPKESLSSSASSCSSQTTLSVDDDVEYELSEDNDVKSELRVSIQDYTAVFSTSGVIPQIPIDDDIISELSESIKDYIALFSTSVGPPQIPIDDDVKSERSGITEEYIAQFPTFAGDPQKPNVEPDEDTSFIENSPHENYITCKEQPSDDDEFLRHNDSEERTDTLYMKDIGRTTFEANNMGVIGGQGLNLHPSSLYRDGTDVETKKTPVSGQTHDEETVGEDVHNEVACFHEYIMNDESCKTYSKKEYTGSDSTVDIELKYAVPEEDLTSYTDIGFEYFPKCPSFDQSYDRVPRGKAVDQLMSMKEFNPRPPRFLPLQVEPEAEKVDLRHQLMDDRRNAEEWMLDYALRKTIGKLDPAQKKHVAVLVEAFETVMPLTKCETQPTTCFTHVSPVQACN